MKKILLFIAIFSSSLFLSCSGLFETFQGTFHSTSDLATFPKTDVSKYRINRGFYFPENTPVYDIVTCLGGTNKSKNVTHYNYNDIPSKGIYYGNEWTDIKINFSRIDNTETYIVNILNADASEKYSFSFTFDIYLGITEVEYTNSAFTIYNKAK